MNRGKIAGHIGIGLLLSSTVQMSRFRRNIVTTPSKIRIKSESANIFSEEWPFSSVLDSVNTLIGIFGGPNHLQWVGDQGIGISISL
jgi:hypothetical protein